MKFAHLVWAAFPFFVMMNVAGVTVPGAVFFALGVLVVAVVVFMIATGMLTTRLIIDYIRASLRHRK